MVYIVLICLLLCFFSIYWQPRWFIQGLSSWRTECTWWSPHGRRVLTIDDVPGPAMEELLQILRETGCQCSFFCIGSLVDETNRPMLVRAIKEGHHIANHGWRDARAGLQNHNQLISEIKRTGALISSLYREAGVEEPEIQYYRPGCGLYGPRLAKIADELPGYRLVLGSLYPHDPQVPLSKINLLHIGSRWTDRDILILHDRTWTPATLRALLPRPSGPGLMAVSHRDPRPSGPGSMAAPHRDPRYPCTTLLGN